MIKLNGFDERYAYGIAYDDREILHRIHILGLKILSYGIEHPICFHQYHDGRKGDKEFLEESKKNLNIFNNMTRKEKGFIACRI